MKVNNISNFNSSVRFKGANAESFFSNASNMTSWQQRGILGVSAMVFQPIIDLTNKDLDLESRKRSAGVSFAKAFVGMTTGIALRGGVLKLCEMEIKKHIDGFAKLAGESKDYLLNGGGVKKYASITSTIMALLIMIRTNFKIDMPLTNFVTNKVNSWFDAKQSKTDEGVKNA